MRGTIATQLRTVDVSDKCDRCGFDKFVDVVLRHPPHDGQSVRRDCARCKLTAGFPVWYGRELPCQKPQPMRGGAHAA
jgi:hypothetical protein